MKNINNYYDFLNSLNESEINEKLSITGILDKLSNVLKNMADKRRRKEALKLSEQFKDTLKDLKISIIRSKYINSREMINNLKSKISEDLMDALNLETFIRGIEFKVMKKFNFETKINDYFDKYMATIDKRLLKYYGVDQDQTYETEPYFREYQKIKKYDKSVIDSGEFKREKTLLDIELLKLMEWVKKNNKRVLITCDGRDGSGKGSFIKLMTEYTNPKIVKSSVFDIPSEEERKDWFKRYIDKFPKKGEIMLFDRSWYNRAVNDPAMNYCTEEEYLDFMKNVNPFEERMIDSGIIYIKFWFMITKENQAIKFELRKTNPLKYWKYSPNDEKTVSKWDIFTKLRDQMFNRTSTIKSPWVVIDSNDKVVGQLNALRYILSKIPYENKNEKIIKPYPEVVYEIL